MLNNVYYRNHENFFQFVTYKIICTSPAPFVDSMVSKHLIDKHICSTYLLVSCFVIE